MDITATLARLESKYDEYGVYTGNKTSQTPAYTYNLAAQYKHFSGIFVRGEIEGYEKTYYDKANTIERDPFYLINAKIGYEASNWDVYFYGKNLFDKEYFSYGRDSGIGARKTVGAPRTFGVIASIRF